MRSPISLIKGNFYMKVIRREMSSITKDCLPLCCWRLWGCQGALTTGELRSIDKKIAKTLEDMIKHAVSWRWIHIRVEVLASLVSFSDESLETCLVSVGVQPEHA